MLTRLRAFLTRQLARWGMLGAGDITHPAPPASMATAPDHQMLSAATGPLPWPDRFRILCGWQVSFRAHFCCASTLFYPATSMVIQPPNQSPKTPAPLKLPGDLRGRASGSPLPGS